MEILRWFSLLIIIAGVIVGFEAKRLSIEKEDDLELSAVNARSFLEKYDSNNFEKQMNDADCVLCKFNMIPCCKPNLCIKKRLRPDECLELRPR